MKPVAILFVFISLASNAQNLQLEREIALPFVPSMTSMDQSGFLYLVSDKGLVVKYSPQGDSLLAFSPRKNSEISVFDPHSSLRPFVFYENFQEFTFLDQFLTFDRMASFYPDLVGYATRVTVSSDNNLWVIDATDFSLKKYNTRTNVLESTIPLSLTLDEDGYQVIMMKEYQNRLFILDATNGLFVFDTYGNLQKKIPVTPDYIHFHNNEIIYTLENKIISMNIYSGEKRELSLPQNNQPRHVLRGGSRFYFLQGERLRIFRLNETKK